jgi:hypothetical protein
MLSAYGGTRMNSNFLEQFIKREGYLQNPPMEAEKFIKSFCKERGIKATVQELEFFEKEKLLLPIIRINRPIVEREVIKFSRDGKEGHRPAEGGLHEGETEVGRHKAKSYSSYGFDEHSKSYLLSWVKEGILFDPADRPFQDWSSFRGEELRQDSQQIVSFYSSFQIYWLEHLKGCFTCDINFAYLGLSAETCRDSIERYIGVLNRTKDKLREEYDSFGRFLRFLLSIQAVYYPYARSDSRTIRIEGDDKEWSRLRNESNLKYELEHLGMKIDDVAMWYKTLSDRSRKLLGITRDDWMQLWRNISWERKDKLEGSIRLGIEYLQWSLMLKRVVEEYLGREILDVDEMGNIAPEDALKFIPSEETRYRVSTRAIRNKRYFDPEGNKNYYHDKYKRLFYLANDFRLDYQPRVVVFVEGKTEERIFPKVFEWYYNKPEDLGVEFVRFEGVDRLLSTSKSAEKLRGLITQLQREEKQKILSKRKNRELNQLIKELQDVNIVISNWTSFLSYNLEKWQITPFFVSDDEGNIKHFLESEKPIRFDGENHDVPQCWLFLWGDSNKNKPFIGKSFELANFSDSEISDALTEVLGRNITERQIRELRYSGKPIKAIDGVEKEKVKIAEKLFNRLFDMYARHEDDTIAERPIFRVVERIVHLAVLNHPPTDRQIELENKRIIRRELSGEIGGSQ